MKQTISLCCLLSLAAILPCFSQSAPAASSSNTDEDSASGPILGIDLGTTYSCAAIFLPSRNAVEIIPNDQGNRITPSYVAFSFAEGRVDDASEPPRYTRLVGDPAKNQATLNPQNTVFDVKRFIGRRYHDDSVQADVKYLPYEIANVDDRPFISIQPPSSSSSTNHAFNDPLLFAPEEISAMILSKLKSDSERYLGHPLHRAVITVPAYFNDAQRHSTRDAGRIAGLEVVRIINEPTAAAIAYGLHREGEENVLVFDLGGGTFDVTALTIDGGIFEVLATNGDTHLGGSDFDQTVMDYFIDKIERSFKGNKSVGAAVNNIRGNKRALQKLRREAERVKRALSTQLSARVEIEELLPGYDFSETLTRAKFEELNEPLFQKTLMPVKRVLEDADLNIDEVHQIILVGGSTRIPRVQSLVKDFFNGKEPNRGINPDESVAVGAAIQGSILSGEGGETVKDVMLLDVTPLSLGTESDGGLMTVLIKRGTTIPTESSHDFHTVEDNQQRMTIDVYEGERSQVKNNHLLGLFDMTDLPPAPRGGVKVRITFKVDANGILEVTAQNLSTQSKKSITITAEDGRLSEEEMRAMVEEAEKFAEQDRKEAGRIEARNTLESYLYRVGSTLNENEDRIENKNDLKTLMDSVDEMKEWLDLHQDESEEEFHKKYSEIEALSKPMLHSMYSNANTYDGFDDEL
ncbi:hypothetical protein HJC23_013794 [Cyclotella cryptica]|uniref:Heat shock protein 70 n=1 Tax=Cyclotella cryptica TaxID=29204 RepID=A0ABD3PGN5_9STRA|eukprot:CCRYP_014952-RB/>CCRYP_014952-RB protein AED:0.23 eAED:0.23 QI:60/-1/1/1/-1/1/1/42/690